MEHIASSDLIDLLLLQREAIDVQFQFWISVTFALVVACFVAGSKIQPGYRLLLGGLYLMATATFLIVAMSSFRLDPTARGTGGFDLVAESSEPVFQDLNSPEGRDDLLPPPVSMKLWNIMVNKNASNAD